jgi:DNA invertase Pin-like site-specific DNA recombinase
LRLLDITTPYGRAMAQMASVFAELERAMIKERTRRAMSVKRSRGERISGHAPFGWDFGLVTFRIGNRLSNHGAAIAAADQSIARSVPRN